MATKSVVWVVPEGGVGIARAAAELALLGFAVVPSSPKDAPRADADLRVLPCGAFQDLSAFAIEYGNDIRPTLALADSAQQEYGILEVLRDFDEVGRCDEPVPVTARRLARLAARYDKNERARAWSHIDPLTRLPNRRNFVAALRHATQSAASGERKGVLFLDLDNFRRINDEFGHMGGDAVLMQIAERLSQQRSEGESLARAGADEFLFLLVRGDDRSLRQAAERIRQSIAQIALELGGSSRAITASAGLRIIEPADEPSAITVDADMAMYEAKAQGRNALFVFGDPFQGAAEEEQDPRVRHFRNATRVGQQRMAAHVTAMGEGLFRSANREANEDPVTGLPNRRYYDRKIRSEIERANREELPLTIALIDLDRLHEINRTFEYVDGDKALCCLADTALAHIRTMDWGARLGGDEFCLVMPGTALQGGQEVAERVRSAVEAAVVLSADQRRIPVTASIVVAQWEPGMAAPVDLLRKADSGLIEAKRRGGNCVVAVPSRA